MESDATRQEQALCIRALQSEEYDTMTDEEWISLCETIAQAARAPAG